MGRIIWLRLVLVVASCTNHHHHHHGSFLVIVIITIPNSILHSTDWLKGKMLLLKLLPFSHVSRLVLDYMENSFSNKPSTNRKYPLGFFFSILIALSTISLMDGSPAVSFGRSTSYCIWEYSKSPVWKRKSLDCEAHLDLDENRWKSCKYKRNSINTDSN